MAAIISDKFRIFNAKQFLESLSEGANDTSADRTRMYFFVGRPQAWAGYIETYSVVGGSFTVGNEVYVGSAYANATFRATIAAVYSNAILVTGVFGSQGVNSTPGAIGASLVEWDGAAATGVTASAGVYRYGTENEPPLPLDNQTEKFDVFDDIIAAKRITDEFARGVIRRYNWDLVANPIFDMWKPDYSSTPAGGGQVGKAASTGATAIGDAKFYVMNSSYEVFKCLYNGQNPSNPGGQNATQEPLTTSGNYSNGIFTESAGAGYVWKYMYTLPTDDVLRFLSSDFLPVVLPTEASRIATAAAAVDGEIDVVLRIDDGAGLPAATTLYSAIRGDGSGGVVQVTTTAGGAIDTLTVVAKGSGYTYASVDLSDGNCFGQPNLTSPVSTTGQRSHLEVVLPPRGGHGSDMELELNAKRVMTNIRLTYAEGSGDFPVDNDFRRIGIIKDPLDAATTAFATSSTLSGLFSVKITGTGGTDYIADEVISQTVNSGANTAYGTVVSWVLDSGSTTDGILKYYQSPSQHIDADGKVYAFEANGAQAVTGADSQAAGSPDTTNNAVVEGVQLTNGLASPEIDNNSGDIIYVENRRLITRAPDQIEDIKLVIEF